MKTSRGFILKNFNDDYGEKCSLQESSSCIPHIWLGVHTPAAKIMWKDAQALGLNLSKKSAESNECGWCDYPIPETVLLSSRMHLNQDQAKRLAQELLFFAENGYLEDNEIEFNVNDISEPVLIKIHK